MAPTRSLTRRLLSLLALPLLLSSSGCVTAAVWEECGSTAGAVALTPVTVAVDAALIAGYVVLVGGASCCGCDDLCIDFD
jgi:hypothetical protein